MTVYVVMFGDGSFTEIEGIYLNEGTAEQVKNEIFDPSLCVDVWIEAHKLL